MAAATKHEPELEVQVDPALFNDARTAFILGRLTRGDAKPADMAGLYAEFIELALGGPTQAMAAMNAYAGQNGGRCDLSEFTEWLLSKVQEAGAPGKN